MADERYQSISELREELYGQIEALKDEVHELRGDARKWQQTANIWKSEAERLAGVPQVPAVEMNRGACAPFVLTNDQHWARRLRLVELALANSRETLSRAEKEVRGLEERFRLAREAMAPQDEDG